MTTYNENGLGGISSGGSSTNTFTYNFATSGGSTIGGSAELVLGGGVILSGGADVYMCCQPIESVIYNPSVSGGSIASGDAVHVENIISSGGVSIGGNLVVENVIRNVTASGGGVLGDSTVKSFTYNFDTSGGATLYGIPVYSFILSPSISGGVIVSGKSLVPYDNIASGGAVVSGEIVGGYIIRNIVSSGGATISPNSIKVEYWLSNHASGGVRVGSNTKFEKISTITSFTQGVGRALKSDNILKESLPYQNLIQIKDAPPELEESKFRIRHTGKWCEVEEACPEGVLPKIIQKRQGEDNLPDKSGTTAPSSTPVVSAL